MCGRLLQCLAWRIGVISVDAWNAIGGRAIGHEGMILLCFECAQHLAMHAEIWHGWDAPAADADEVLVYTAKKGWTRYVKAPKWSTFKAEAPKASEGSQDQSQLELGLESRTKRDSGDV